MLPLMRSALASIIMLTLAACGGDETNNDDTDAQLAGDAGADASATDTGASDPDGDAGIDASADVTEPDATEPDATEPDAADVEEECFTPEPACIGECRLDFFNSPPGRPSVFQIDIQNLNQGTMNIVDVLIADAPPEMTLSDGWFGYMDRAGNGTWEPSGNRQGFDVSGDPIPVGETDVFTVDVRLADRSEGVQCPSGNSRDCGTLLIEVPNCDGTPIFTAVQLQF
ncbi:MAG: hypothetical protein ACI81R_001943 [Bradymonadia bacterium]|jgi:hypothetical protein